MLIVCVMIGFRAQSAESADAQLSSEDRGVVAKPIARHFKDLVAMHYTACSLACSLDNRLLLSILYIIDNHFLSEALILKLNKKEKGYRSFKSELSAEMQSLHESFKSHELKLDELKQRDCSAHNPIDKIWSLVCVDSGCQNEAAIDKKHLMSQIRSDDSKPTLEDCRAQGKSLLEDLKESEDWYVRSRSFANLKDQVKSFLEDCVAREALRVKHMKALSCVQALIKRSGDGLAVQSSVAEKMGSFVNERDKLFRELIEKFLKALETENSFSYVKNEG